MSNSSSNRELFTYYNERAPEYEAFYHGDFPAKIPNPETYRDDTAAISKLLPDYLGGKCIDIACGTGFWLTIYQKNCSRITLIDQSESALAECAKKIEKLKIATRAEIIHAEIFSHHYKKHQYDSALTGFFISHLPEAEMDTLMAILRKLLIPGGRLVIIDSTWNEQIAKIRGIKAKAGMIKRALYDGREFQIYKRYFEKQDLDCLAEKYDMNLKIVYWGEVFFMAAARCNNIPA
jgi:ubiquinone/menaquinone biosynthesis C-methylase UbiE